MEHNEGREPTDAALLMRLAVEITAAERGTSNMEEGELAIKSVIARGREYLSGQRPMPGSEVSRAEVLRMSTDTLLKAEAERLPDTPAPDEVERLRAEVARLKAERFADVAITSGAVFSEEPDYGAERMRVRCQRCGAVEDVPCTSYSRAADLLAKNTRLSARVAELEAELDKARGVFRGATILPFRSTPKVNMDDDMVRVTVDMTRRAWNRVRPIAAPGKEPTSE